MRWVKMSLLAAVACSLVCSVAVAQRGIGKSSGVAQQAVLPEVTTLNGTVIGVETGPCENTTGYSLLGTHFLMKGPKGATLNIHLGPVGVVDFVAKELVEGQAVEVKAFRTVGMKAGHYVACTVSTKGRRVTLRDSMLRPAWAGGRWGAGGPTTTGIGYGRGGGPGWQRGGYGGGRGRGRGWGRGRGGYGYGMGMGQCPRFGTWETIPKTEAKAE